MQCRIIFVHLFYLVDQLSGADKYCGADTEYAGTTGYRQNTAQAVVVVKAESYQQRHHDEFRKVG